MATWSEYQKNVKADAMKYIDEMLANNPNITWGEAFMSAQAADSVTGLNSGSYFHDAARAQEEVNGILFDIWAHEDFERNCYAMDVAQGAELLDVDARCVVMLLIEDDLKEYFFEKKNKSAAVEYTKTAKNFDEMSYLHVMEFLILKEEFSRLSKHEIVSLIAPALCFDKDEEIARQCGVVKSHIHRFRMKFWLTSNDSMSFTMFIKLLAITKRLKPSDYENTQKYKKLMSRLNECE